MGQHLSAETALKVHLPLAGMFVMINISATGMNDNDYALHLLEHGGVAVMPRASFGDRPDNWVRIALTVDDAHFNTGCDRIIKHANTLGLKIT